MYSNIISGFKTHNSRKMQNIVRYRVGGYNRSRSHAHEMAQAAQIDSSSDSDDGTSGMVRRVSERGHNMALAVSGTPSSNNNTTNDGNRTDSGQPVLKTDRNLARMLDKNYGKTKKTKSGWTNIFQRVTTKKLAYRLNKHFGGATEDSFAKPKLDFKDYEDEMNARKKPVVIKNLAKKERQRHLRYLGIIPLFHSNKKYQLNI